MWEDIYMSSPFLPNPFKTTYEDKEAEGWANMRKIHHCITFTFPKKAPALLFFLLIFHALFRDSDDRAPGTHTLSHVVTHSVSCRAELATRAPWAFEVIHVD